MKVWPLLPSDTTEHVITDQSSPQRRSQSVRSPIVVSGMWTA